jgi:uncharacterized membrane protein (UPF0127 family)
VTVRRVVLAVVLLLAACGSSDSSNPSDGATDATTTSSTVTTTTPGPSTTTSSEPDEGPFAAGRTPLAGFGEVQVRIVEGPDGEPIVICVLVADTPEERQRGLMEVTDLGGYDGMLFRFEADTDGGFWMKDTLLPLSIAYLDADGAVVSTADMEPCPDGTSCPSYPATGPYRMALEVPQGGLAPLGLAAGSPARLEITGPCQPLTPDP